MLTRLFVCLQVEAGRGFGMKVTGVITRMDSPLGNAVGNALEVAEAIDALQNKGPSDVQEIVFTLGSSSSLIFPIPHAHAHKLKHASRKPCEQTFPTDFLILSSAPI